MGDLAGPGDGALVAHGTVERGDGDAMVWRAARPRLVICTAGLSRIRRGPRRRSWRARLRDWRASRRKRRP